MQSTHAPCEPLPQGGPATAPESDPSSSALPAPLVAVQKIGKDFVRGGGLGAGRQRIRAVQGVSCDVFAGRTLGIVGESGCGKSTLGRMLVGLLEPSCGEVFIQGRPLWDKKAHRNYAAFRKSLAGVAQMVFQDPYSSLNPRMRIGNSIAEPLVCSTAWRKSAATSPASIADMVARMLVSVGLGPDAARRYPHEFSGGQRQRIAIARALVTRPAFVVCDEPTSSLDASVQAQVLNLLRDMQDELGLAYLFISHDLAVVRHMSDTMLVMYLGHVVESGEAEQIFAQPLHPYTRLLLDASSAFDGCKKTEGSPAAQAQRPKEKTQPLPAGAFAACACPFAPGCPMAMPHCHSHLPQLCAVEQKEGLPHAVRCFLYNAETATTKE